MLSPQTGIVADLLREGFERGQLAFLTVTSASMSPLLRAGDRIGVQQVALQQLQDGDIVVVRHGKSFLTHRFHATSPAADGPQRSLGLPGGSDRQTYFITRGDRVGSFDPLWQESHLLGRVVSRWRNGQSLWLDYGPGRRLNRQLTALAKLEQRLGAYRLPPGQRSLQPAQRPLRAGLRAVAALLTTVAELAD